MRPPPAEKPAPGKKVEKNCSDGRPCATLVLRFGFCSRSVWKFGKNPADRPIVLAASICSMFWSMLLTMTGGKTLGVIAPVNVVPSLAKGFDAEGPDEANA